MSGSLTATLQPGEWLAVFGVGGIGLSAVQIAEALGAQIVAVDISDEKLHRAKLEGASVVIIIMRTARTQWMVAVYTQDAKILPPNSSAREGHPAIQAFWQGVINLGIKSAKLETVELEGDGDLAYEMGTYQLMVQGGQAVDNGKYVVVWKLQDGKWKWHRDIRNSNVSAAK